MASTAHRVHPGSFLTLHYRLAGPGGDIINTFKDKPATLTLGTGELSPAVEKRLLGLEEGAHATFEIPPGEAFGDRNPEMLRRLARELSDRMGAVTLLLGVEREELVRMILFERGRIVDEYLSVPEFYGPLPPGDVVGLAANPTVVSRLTGAEPDAVRRVARTAPSPADLPPARELLGELADVMGIEGAETGWADTPELAGAVRIERT